MAFLMSARRDVGGVGERGRGRGRRASLAPRTESSGATRFFLSGATRLMGVMLDILSWIDVQP
jgi:hypothetical protein